ncbi:MAG TPA: class III poly(R)-hydroxyalkanoic acid synthase subunit PhaC [Steroidobacteraceae bacterium]|nr:class III poly(R)-hydroxyalkanoic acid synthase subunit PhaC [Steroidobacteraceae bacterium]
MTSRLALDPLRVAAEVADFSQRMAIAAGTLASIDARDEGCTPRTEVFRHGKTVLWRYRSGEPGAGIAPLVICYALVNRPYMLDLQPDRSLVRGLVARGLDVYLVDWGYPDRSDSGLSLDDYVNRHLGACIDRVRAMHGIPAVNLLGVCQGGTLSLCHASLHPDRVRNLVTMVTPVDFHTKDNLLSHWVRRLDVDRIVDVLGNVPGALLNAAFVALMPLRLTVRKYAAIADLAGDRASLENFLRMERWIHDSPDQAGTAFREFVRDFFQENRLLRGGLSIGGETVDLRRITCPVLNVYALQDHLVPPDASRALEGLTGSRDYSAFEFDGGHIGIYVSRSAQELLPRTIAQWLGSR